MPNFILRTDTNKAHCLEHIRNLQGVWEVEVREYRKKRTNNANSRYWVAVVTPIARHTGYEPEEMHEILKYKFLGMETVEIGGKEIQKLRSTRKLTTQQFADYMLQCEAWGAGLGVNFGEYA